MKNKREEIWYCENYKGQKIPPYVSNYTVPKPKKRRVQIIKMLIFILIWGSIIMFLSSCSTFKITEKEKELNYKIDKLYLEYSYKRDSLLLEYNNTKE